MDAVLAAADRVSGPFIGFAGGDSLADFERARLSVAVFEVHEGGDAAFRALAVEHDELFARKGYGRAETVRDEGFPLRFYAVRHWSDRASAERCHADADVRAVTSKIYQLARVSHVVNGARKADPLRLMLDDRRTPVESDRRTGFDRRVETVGRPEGDRRARHDRRLGPRRLRAPVGALDLVGAARRAREHADAAFSHTKIGAALLTADGTIITGCNIENATFGLTMCAERVAIFKALSEGHRAFTRIVIVTDLETPAPPCGACRQILWEFGGNLDVTLANLTQEVGTHQLRNLLPLPFDARVR